MRCGPRPAGTVAPGRAGLSHQFDTYLEWVHSGRVRQKLAVPYTAARGPGEGGVPGEQEKAVTSWSRPHLVRSLPCWGAKPRDL